MKESGELDTLKIVNIIFNEHSQLTKENLLLKTKVSYLEELDSIASEEVQNYKEEVSIYRQEIKSNNSTIKKLKFFNKLLSIESIVLLIFLFI